MLDPIRHILLPTDFSPLAETALESAARLARRDDATCHLLHVIRLPFVHTTYDMNVPQSVWDALREQADRELDAAEERLRAAGVRHVERLISENLPPAEFIAQHARALEADLVVIATHGRQGLAHAFLGSIAEKTVRTCPAPVLAVKEAGIPEAGLQRILVAVDFSPPAERAESLAAGLARPAGATIELMHVLEGAPEYALRVVPEIARLEAKARERVVERLKARKEALEASGLDVQTYLAEGSPDEQITQHAAASKADLIVMGTHGHRGLDHLTLGSVAERTLRLAPCPVLTTRPPESEG